MSNLRTPDALKVSDHHPLLTNSRMGGRARCKCGWDSGLLRSQSRLTDMRKVVSLLWADHMKETLKETDNG